MRASYLGPTTVVNKEYDENGGVTKTVTTTTTEEREYKAGHDSFACSELSLLFDGSYQVGFIG